MTKPWKLKTNSSNILLVLITLILVKAEWAKGEPNDSWESNNLVGEEDGQQNQDHVQIYVGNDEIAQFFFRSSLNNNSLILENINKCLENFQLMTCLKMLLLERINNVLTLLQDPNFTKTDLYFLNGLIVFKTTNDTDASVYSEKSDSSSLDDEISYKVRKMFENRTLRVSLLPRVKLDITPARQTKDGFICFTYKIHREIESTDDDNNIPEESRGRKKRKKGGGMSMMMLPPLIMLGLMPFTLASVKSLVMNAMMINMMALNGLIFMTVRNLIFGPRPGSNVKYVNYGYSKDRQTQSPKPTLIIHSAAAFVKQPKVRKKPIHPFPPQGQVGDHHNYESSNGDYGDIYYPNTGTYHGGYYQGYHGEEYVIHDHTYDGNNYHHYNRRQNHYDQKQQGSEHVRSKINNFKNFNVNGYQRNSTVNSQVYPTNAKFRSSYNSRVPKPVLVQNSQKISINDFRNTQTNVRIGKRGISPKTQGEQLEQGRVEQFKGSPQWDPVISD